VKVGADDAQAHVAMADVLRLQGKPSKDVQKELARALTLAKGDREAMLVGALLAIRDKKPEDARELLDKLDSGEGALEQSGDVRPRFRKAMLAFAAGDSPAAQKAAEDVIGVQSEHAAAQALLRRLRDAVAISDPMPPEDPDDEPENKSGTGTGTGTGTGSSGKKPDHDDEPKGDYDSLLKKADALAEVDCGQAMPYYTKALEQKPNGVAALTGRGYCYIDSKQFSSAHSSFRAALAVSRRYEPALWGVAEAYQQQGLKEKAIEAYMSYLVAYPGTAKAIKQIERLGGSVDGGGGKTEPQPDPPPPEPEGGESGGDVPAPSE
jgi:tetratricopeptide (TPR) repeat protein